ncbi:MAG: helix-turn-helix transcriptional regulator [Nocardiopsaceae bacterium]|nr:helix-turn-helix transcriptional regulator [Nocardiopsaceae bacterium]MDA8372464.1 helix-turn-helix transcriptional regulator [Nocardiopsaceae bacterium]
MTQTVGEVLAARVRHYRKTHQLSVRELAERCAELGAPQLTAAALGNIERGQDPQAKRKAREVTREELFILSHALRVPAVLLMFPIGDDTEIEVLPGKAATPWEAAKWFTGEARPAWMEDAERADFEAASSGREWHTTSWGTSAAPVWLFRRHEQQVAEWGRASMLVKLMAGGIGGRPPMIPELEDISEESQSTWSDRLRGFYEQQIQVTRREIRGHGLKPPRLPVELVHLDD